jgi:N-acetylglucosamine kinase-like BadF-type ATPase
LEAAFGEGAGVIAIAGTGSIVYGRDGAGHTARAGGWGFAISDEGSGHWIGRRAISAVVNAHDQGLATSLTAMLIHTWKVAGFDELVRQANATPPPDFPRLFRIVQTAADDGDPIARALLAAAGTELAGLASRVIRRLSADAKVDERDDAKNGEHPTTGIPVAMTGSVFRQSLQVRDLFCASLREQFPGIDVRQDLAEPVAGALARARRM